MTEKIMEFTNLFLPQEILNEDLPAAFSGNDSMDTNSTAASDSGDYTFLSLPELNYWALLLLLLCVVVVFGNMLVILSVSR